MSIALWQLSHEAYFDVLSELSPSAKRDILSDREYREKSEDSGAVKFFDGVREAHISASGGEACSYSFLTELIVAYYAGR